uniref:Uncharacterized protein n=1 Tax=viral metagenome TaxID=1070528 RepID=A0A6C0KBQ6_9ZZZZ
MSLSIVDQVKKTILQDKAFFSRTLSSQLGLCSRQAAHFRNSQKFRSWITKNVFLEYTPISWHRKISPGESTRILKAFYGTCSECDISDFAEHIKRLGVVFDLFGQDTAGTITAVKLWFEHKGVNIPGPHFLLGACLYAQLSYMGHRVNRMGYGSHNLISTATAERAYIKRVAAETARKEAFDQINKANMATEGGDTPAENDADAQARDALDNLECDWDEEW